MRPLKCFYCLLEESTIIQRCRIGNWGGAKFLIHIKYVTIFVETYVLFGKSDFILFFLVEKSKAVFAHNGHARERNVIIVNLFSYLNF